MKGNKNMGMVENLFKSDIDNCLKALKGGEVILYPTDTVWGIGCDASNELAVQKVIDIKGRLAQKAFIVLIDDLNKLSRYVKHVPEVAYELMELSPNPLTLIFDEGVNVANAVKANDGSLAIRCVKDDFCRQLIHKFNKPLVSTSANVSGEQTPAFFKEISAEIIRQVDYCTVWRQNETTRAVASTLIRIKNNGEFSIIRK